jgi:hypothetical protein
LPRIEPGKGVIDSADHLGSHLDQRELDGPLSVSIGFFNGVPDP